MIRNQRKSSTVTVLPGLALDLNPFSSRLGARVLRNFVPERGRLARKTFSPAFTVKPTASGGDVWHIHNFRYIRANAAENKLITFRADGKVYDRQSTWEQEIYPALASSVAGPSAPVSATNTDSGGPAWSNPLNVLASDGSYASVTVTVGGTDISDYLDVSFSSVFAVAATNEIQSVVVFIEANLGAGAAGGILHAQLTSGGSPLPGSSSQSVGLGSWGSTDDSVALAGGTWGANLDPSTVNGSFGVRIWIDPIGALGASRVVNIDQATMMISSSSTANDIVRRPFVGQLSNRLFFSDKTIQKVYDGRGAAQNWGLARSTTAPTVTAQNLAGSIVAATGVKGCITWVVLDEEGNRVHESSRSNVSGFVVIGGVDDSVRLDITALSAPTRATHWSAYISELDGSEVYRRAATTRITTLTVDVTAFPAATSPKAPIRNDPPPLSTVGWIAKNRIFVRDDINPNTFYFSALGEVKGLLNGAPEESFPGYGANAISDITNSDFIPDREIRCGVEHENIIFIWGEKNGYALIGELNLLDNRAPRSLIKLRQFSENCSGPTAAASTPYGLAWMSSGRKILLWIGGEGLINVGEPIQRALDTIPNGDLEDVDFKWWGGKGRQWLVVCLRCRTPDDDTDAGLMNRVYVYDFSIPQRRPDGIGEPGTWFEWPDIAATCSGVYYDEEGSPFLLFGNTSSEVVLADVVANPAHLNYTASLGETYFGSTVQNNPRAIMRSGLLLPSGDIWSVGNYFEMQTGDQDGPGAPAAGSLTQPTIEYVVDVENPDSIGTPIALTFDTALTSGDRRAWLVPQATGNTNVGGAFGKQFIAQVSYAAGNDSTGEADGRLSTRQNSVYKMGFSFVPQKEMSQ